MYLSATSAATGLELWKTDGTVAGTVLVKDIQDGAYGSGVRNLTNVNGTLFFSADDGVGGYELWKSDGTSAGTTLVSDIQRGRGGSSPSNFVALGSTLIFSANDGSNGVVEWNGSWHDVSSQHSDWKRWIESREHDCGYRICLFHG
jgi:ELWxxDGT repeat protein